MRLQPSIQIALTGSLLIAASLLAGSPAAGAESFTVHHLLDMQRLSSTTLSPDGKTAAFVIRTTDLEANRGRTDLWAVSVPVEGADAAAPQRMTSHEAADFEPNWAPDSSGLYFLSTRSGSSQVWFLPSSGGEARQVTDLPLDVSNLRVAPDGKSLAFTLEVFVDCETLTCTTERLAARESAGTTGQVYDDLFARHWDHWEDGRRSHVFTLALEVSDASPVDLMEGMDADAPSQPFGGAEEILFVPDASGVVFTSRAAPDVAGSAESWSTNHDLWFAPVDGSEPPRNLTASNKAWDTQPQFSADGAALFYLAMARPGYESDRMVLQRLDWARSGATPVPVAAEWDRSVSSYVVADQGGTIYATAQDVGETGLFRIDVESGRVKRLIDHGSGTVRGFDVGAHGLVFERQDLAQPSELYLLAGEAAAPIRLTRFNDDRLAEIEFGAWEQFSFPGWGDETVHGYVVYPKDLAAGEKLPVAFLIHGGPQGSFSNNFHYRWNPQTYVGAGYAVVMIDFHGSTGYGQDFTDSINDDWGGKPLEDLQKGLAAAIERYSFLDGSRVCALGASYGGYMINWIAGQWSDRFECLVNHDGLFDNRSMYFTTEELWFVEWDHGGTYFDNPQGHEKHNPMRYVDRWQTPMLVIHGELDYRVPITQGLATFTALQRRGIPSRLLYFPDENHWVLQPKNSIQWHDEVLAWLDRWLGER